MNIIISGGSGFIGSRLSRALEAAGHEVRAYSRSARESAASGKTIQWDPVSGPPPPGSLADVDAVVYLSGESVAHRWTDDLKKKIRDSRILGTRNLVAGIAAADRKPKVLVCSSASGYYGDRGEEELTEESTPGSSFLAEVCKGWENEADRATALGLRVVKVRTGMVLGQGGGALERLTSAFKSKMGGKLGSGKQWIPWIHMSDILGIYQRAIEGDFSGTEASAWNGASPHPVRNEELTDALGEALGEPARMTVPEFALKMMFGEMADVLLGSQRVLPKATLAAGYRFRFTDVHQALADVVKRG